jgi:hypothetical protein
MEITHDAAVAPRRPMGRGIVGLALVVAVSGAFAFGRATAGTDIPTAPQGPVVQQLANGGRPAIRPMIRPKDRGTVKADPDPLHRAPHHRPKWG